MTNIFTHRRLKKELIQEVWSHITGISSLRSVNSPPHEGVEENFTFLERLLLRIENLVLLQEGKRGLQGLEGELPYLDFAINQLKRYNTPAGVIQMKEEDARMYIFFVQSRYMELVQKMSHLLV